MSSRPPLPIVGQAVQVKERTETPFYTGRPQQVWTFRLRDGKDASGNALPPTLVEMRGRRFTGGLNEGEEIRVYGKWRNGLLVANRVFNQTTQSWFGVSSAYPSLRLIATIVVVALSLALVVFGWPLVREIIFNDPAIPESPAGYPVDPR